MSYLGICGIAQPREYIFIMIMTLCGVPADILGADALGEQFGQ
jgi:hypothetical protein